MENENYACKDQSLQEMFNLSYSKKQNSQAFELRFRGNKLNIFK